MKTKSISFITFLTVCLVTFCIACKELKEPVTESGDAAPVDPQDAVSLIYNNLEEIDGTTDIELTQEQRDAFYSKLKADMAKSDDAQSGDLPNVMSVITKSSIEAIGSLPPPGLSDMEKLAVLEDVLGSQAEFLNGLVQAEEALASFGQISLSAMENMDSIFIQTASSPQVLEKLSSSLIKSTGKVSINDEPVKGASSVIVENMITQFDKYGWDQSERNAAINSTLKGSLEGLSDANLNTDDYKEAVADLAKVVSKEATAIEISPGKTQAELINSVEDLTTNILISLADAGVPRSTCSELAPDIISGTAEELNSVLDADQLNQALTNGVTGIVEGLRQKGASEKEQSSASSSGSKTVQNETDKAKDPSAPKLKIGDEKLNTTEEAEENGSFTVSLDKAPKEDISVSIISRDVSEGIVSPANLTINGENWNKPQKITILPQDDWIVDDEISYSIVLKANGKLSKTLVAKNANDDVAGIKVTPSKLQYSSEVGGEVHYQIRLTSEPKSPIMLRWAIDSGSECIEFETEYREMTFPVTHEGTPHIIKIKGQPCSEAEHSSVTIKSQNIISIGDKDADYPELTPTSITFKHLKGGPKIKTTDFIENNVVKVDFDSAHLNFSEPDDEYVYETVFETESIDFTYARYQSRPLLIKESECFNGNVVDLNVTSTPAAPPATGFNYSFTFCLKFYNADLTQTSAGTAGWASGSGFSRTSCSSIGSRYVRCNFSGSGNSLPNSKIPVDTIFSGTSSDKIGNDEYNLLGGSGYYSSPPSIPEQTNRPTINLKYKKLSIKGTKTAYFISESNLRSGFWYLSNKSKSFVLGGSIYSDSNYFYIHVP